MTSFTNSRPGALANALPALPFGPAPLIEGEDAVAYDELLMRISSGVRPADIFEEIWVRDIVDLTWEAFRLRRMKAALMTNATRRALVASLSPRVGGAQAEGLARSWAAREAGAVAAVAEELAGSGHTLEGLAAQGLCFSLDHVERFERMIMNAEVRRGGALREIDRHRAALGARLRAAVIQADAHEQADVVAEHAA